jgi:hypothetical protein
MSVTPTARLAPCARCGTCSLWRDRQGAVRCVACSPPTAYWLITERLTAPPPAVSALERAVQFLNSCRSLPSFSQPLRARLVIEAALGHGIAPATLSRARLHCGLRAVKTKQGWVWVERPHRL